MVAQFHSFLELPLSRNMYLTAETKASTSPLNHIFLTHATDCDRTTDYRSRITLTNGAFTINFYL
jgi:hypothetical protein